MSNNTTVSKSHKAGDTFNVAVNITGDAKEFTFDVSIKTNTKSFNLHLVCNLIKML